MQKINKQAFTLVELIVVITILAILGTIAFISLQGYSRDARDSVRTTDLTNISKQLELMLVKAGQVYVPENKVDITASGTVILYQGEMGQDTLNKLRVNNGGLDPVDQSPYTYSVTKNLKRYELMGFLENGNIAYNQVPSPGRGGLGMGVISQANAATNLTKRFPYVKGNSIGIILDSITNQPINSTGTGVDIVNTNTTYKVYLDNSSSGAVSGTGADLPMLLSKGYNFKTCRDIINLYGNGIKDGTYTINSTGEKSFDIYCDMTTDGGGWTRVLDYNGNIFSGNLDKIDWYQDKDNYSYLYSMINTKNNNGKYEFIVKGYIGINTRWLQFTQTNAYDENPNNNSFNEIAGDFVSLYPNTNWKGLSLGGYGNLTMQSNCILSTSYGNTINPSWWTCIIDNHISYGTGPWMPSFQPNRITILQR